LATVRVLAPFSPTIVQFRPYFVRFESSDIYGAGPFATSHHCLSLCLSTMEDARMEEETNAEAPGATTFTIYIP
jgi:hypothetical protein